MRWSAHKYVFHSYLRLSFPLSLKKKKIHALVTTKFPEFRISNFEYLPKHHCKSIGAEPKLSRRHLEINGFKFCSWQPKSTTWHINLLKPSSKLAPKRKCHKPSKFVQSCIIVHRYIAQCARTDLNKRFLPKQMTTTGWKGTP